VDFLSGTPGVQGRREAASGALADLALDARGALTGRSLRLARDAHAAPARRVLVVGVDRPDRPGLMASAQAELRRSRQDVRFEIARGASDRGKFENLNLLIARCSLEDFDWLLVIDDDVSLPRGFLDRFVFLAERFGLRIAQPAHRRRSHAAWEVTRRQAGAVARETAFVEIGPVTAFHSDTFAELLPFPRLRMGWGLDAHWSAVARDRGWPIGVVDATAIRHTLAPAASSYSWDEAMDEAREFLADRPHVDAAEAQRTLVTHTDWER
jgi:Glycosyl transferase family 2